MALILIVLIPTPAFEKEGGGGAVWGGRLRFLFLKE